MKTRIKLAALLAMAVVLPPAALMMAQQVGAGRNGSARPEGPCDIYAAAGTPCSAAHSTTRALLASYNGPLYQVKRESDGKMLDIGVTPPTASDAGGYADSGAQDAFCANTICVINKICDQSGKGNDLLQAPPGASFPGPAKGGFDTQPIADMAAVSIGGHKVYGVFIMPGMGFRNNDATGLATGDDPEGMYSVIDGKHYDSGCCFDYGNAETNSRDDGAGTMENTYFGTSTTWGSGSGTGPWLMADMEGGVYSGYNAHQNVADPAIDSWRFVTAVVDGGAGNKWDLRGGNAQQGGLSTFYSGPRPGSQTSNRYFPMHKQGGILMGTGGDNGNGSSGTFYEGVMTTGYPTQATTDAVQANIVAAKYAFAPVELSRIGIFTPGSSQDVILTFTNTAGAPASGVTLGIQAPAGWKSVVSGGAQTSKSFADPVAPGASVSATFTLTSPSNPGAGYLTGNARWTNPAGGGAQSESASARVRNAFPVKINEVLLTNPNDQFIELYNAGASDVDISDWSLINTQSQWAPVKLAVIPPGTKLAAKSFYLLGLASSGLAAPASAGDSAVYVRSTTDFDVGQPIDINGENRTITNVGTPAAPMATVFIPVSARPWLDFPAGTTNLPVSSAAGFVVGEKIGIDLGGNYELATVNAVGKAATQTTLSEAAAAGATTLHLAAGSNVTAGDTLTVGTGGRKEFATVKNISTPAAGDTGSGTGGPGGFGPGGFGGGGRGGRGGGLPAQVDLAAPLKFDHASGIDVSDAGTGISFSPATKFAHTSGDAVQALGSGITLDKPLEKSHAYGASIVNPAAHDVGYQGTPAPNQWFGATLSPRAGSLALLDAGGTVIVDAMVYGSQQSNSSGNGTITSPELATLEGDQGKGGCIVVVPNAGRGGFGRGRGAPAAAGPGRSAARVSDGADTGSNCADFQLQTPTPGAPNQKP